jgi:hypothetical protein
MDGKPGKSRATACITCFPSRAIRDPSVPGLQNHPARFFNPPVANPHDVDGVADHVSRLGFLQRRLIDDLARAGRKAGLTEGH